MAETFMLAENMTEAPAIPDTVTDLFCTFANCTSLAGEIEINGEISRYDTCLGNTYEPIFLTGTSTQLEEIAATATNNNVTVRTQQ